MALLSNCSCTPFALFPPCQPTYHIFPLICRSTDCHNAEAAVLYAFVLPHTPSISLFLFIPSPSDPALEMSRVTFFLLILAMFFCLSIFVADGQRRGFRVRTPSRRISSRRITTTTAAPPASTTTAPPVEEEEEEDEEIPRGYSVDRAKTRWNYKQTKTFSSKRDKFGLKVWFPTKNWVGTSRWSGTESPSGKWPAVKFLENSFFWVEWWLWKVYLLTVLLVNQGST